MEKNLWLAGSTRMRETVQDGDGERMKGLASECFKELAIVTWRRLGGGRSMAGGDRGPKVRLSHKSYLRCLSRFVDDWQGPFA